MKSSFALFLGLLLTVPAIADLGTGNVISTVHGKTYRGVVILDMQPDGFTFTHSNGSGRLLFADLPADVRKELGYDEKRAAEFEKARAEKKQKEREMLIERQRAAAQANALARSAEMERLIVLEQQYAVALNNQYAAAAASGFSYPVLAPAVGLQRGLHQTYYAPHQLPQRAFVVKKPEDDRPERPDQDGPDHPKLDGPKNHGPDGPGKPPRGEPLSRYPMGAQGMVPTSQTAVRHAGSWVLIDKGVSSRPFRIRDGVELQAGSATAVRKHLPAMSAARLGTRTAPPAKFINGVPALSASPVPARAPAAPVVRGHAAGVPMTAR